MSQFQYKGRNVDGQTITGRLEAVDEESAATELLQTGLTPISIVEVPAETDVNLKIIAFFEKKVDPDELIIFSRQMYSLSKAGIPMIRALNGLADSTFNVR